MATIEIKEATIMIVAKATNTAHGSLLFDNLPDFKLSISAILFLCIIKI